MKSQTLNPETATQKRATELTDEECERLIREEGPLTACELLALPEAVRHDYFASLIRRLRRVGLTAFRRQVGRAATLAPVAARPIDAHPLHLFLDRPGKKEFTA